MFDTDLKKSDVVPKVDYGVLKPDVDYQRNRIGPDRATLVNGEWVHHEYPVNVFRALLETDEMKQAANNYISNPGYKWSTKKYVASYGDKKWLEVDVLPDQGVVEGREGFVVRLDLETGNPIVVDENKNLISVRWTERRFLELRNGVAKLSGKKEVELPEEKTNPIIESVGADFWKLNTTELEARLVGRVVTDFEKSDLHNPDMHLSVLAVVLTQMRNQGGSYTHHTNTKWFGLINQGLQTNRGNFMLRQAEEIVVNALDRANFLINDRDGVFSDSNNFYISDTQGTVVRINNDGREISVAILKNEKGEDENGRRIFLLTNEVDMSTDQLISIAEHGFGSPGWAGSQEDMDYVMNYYVFRMGQGLYNADIPVSLKTAAAVLAIEHKNNDRDDKDILGFAKENTDKIRVSFPNGEKKIMTWNDLLKKYKKTEKREEIVDLEENESELYYDRNALIIPKVVDLPLEIDDLPDDVVVQRLSE